MNSLFRLINSMGTARLVALAGTTLAAAAFFGYLITRFTVPDMALLYGQLDTDDSSRIVSKLESLGIPYEIGGNGSQIYVLSDKVVRLRMSMAEEGLPSGGSVGYEIFDRSEGMGSSSFVQNVNRLRALEGELARSIRTITMVKTARVHLVLPQRQLFSRTSVQPTASIALQLKGGSRLSRGQISAIQYLVAAAVPGLSPQNVSIVDGRGKLLARGGDDDGSSFAASNAVDMRQSYEQNLARKIEALLERSLGAGTVRTQVTADIDFDRISTSEEVFDPDSQVARSTQTVEESSDSKDGEKGPTPVTVAEELPEPETPNEEAPEKLSTANTNRTEETVNYEISKTVKNQVREAGIVRKVSVAVLVDGTYGPEAEDGTRPYTARSQEDMERITALVRSAIGFDESRGDSVEVVNMQFSLPETSEDEGYDPLFDMDKRDVFRIGEVFILLITAVLAIMFVVRPILQRVLDMLPQATTADGSPAQIGDGTGTEALTDASGEDDGAMIDIGQIEGKVKESSLRKVNEIVQAHPEESVSILRNWMFNEA